MYVRRQTVKQCHGKQVRAGWLTLVNLVVGNSSFYWAWSFNTAKPGTNMYRRANNFEDKNFEDFVDNFWTSKIFILEMFCSLVIIITNGFHPWKFIHENFSTKQISDDLRNFISSKIICPTGYGTLRPICIFMSRWCIIPVYVLIRIHLVDACRMCWNVLMLHV